MDKIAACNPAAALYLRAIPIDMWASAHFPRTRQGHLTSNIVESVNKLLREDRSLSITDLLDAIWHRVMEARACSLKAAQDQLSTGLRWTSFCQTKLEYSRKWARSNHVSLSSI
jgi:hypothetical protein